MRRPRTEIQSILIHQKGEGEQWIPKRFEISSWITLNAPKRGKWAHCGDLKGIIKGFRFKPNSSTVEAVKVAHAYSQKQLQMENKPAGQTNYLYPSEWEDWEDPACIADVIVVLHVDIGQLTRGRRTHKELLEAGIFFYNASYVPPSNSNKFGKLVPLPLPRFDDPTWPLPDMYTSEFWRHHLFSDFGAAMKATTGSRVCSLRWYMPLHVMADLFSVQCEQGLHRTKTLFVFKPISEALFSSLMDDGWDCKVVAANDIIRCQVLKDSVSFRYHIGRGCLYSTFGYVRSRLVAGEWIQMDQCSAAEMLNVEVTLLDASTINFQVGKTWTLKDLRDEIGFYLSEDQEGCWCFQEAGRNGPRKVNPRQEKKIYMSDFGDGACLSLQIAN